MLCYLFNKSSGCKCFTHSVWLLLRAANSYCKTIQLALLSFNVFCHFCSTLDMRAVYVDWPISLLNHQHFNPYVCCCKKLQLPDCKAAVYWACLAALLMWPGQDCTGGLLLFTAAALCWLDCPRAGAGAGNLRPVPRSPSRHPAALARCRGRTSDPAPCLGPGPAVSSSTLSFSSADSFFYSTSTRPSTPCPGAWWGARPGWPPPPPSPQLILEMWNLNLTQLIEEEIIILIRCILMISNS